MDQTIHNPDQYMNDLRQVLAQGRKRLGLLLGAGGPGSVRMLVGKRVSEGGDPLIPATAELTKRVSSALAKEHDEALKGITGDLKSDPAIKGDPNIEQILSRVRALADALGANEVRGLNGAGYATLSEKICAEIGKIVDAKLPTEPTPYSEFVAWIGGTARDHAFEIFTPNYDRLMEQALERARIPYFDGFCGACEPFFDPATIANDELPSRWARLWKLHGSLGWDASSAGEIFRASNSSATRLIYPTHLKYDQTQKLPYTALFDRLRRFLQTPDTLLMTSGFSYSDAHVFAVIDESLAANRAASVMAFQFEPLAKEQAACQLARRRTNMSVYARDGAVINGIEAPWSPGDLPHAAWAPIRRSFWAGESSGKENGLFTLGDFAQLARYVAMTRAEHSINKEMPSTISVETV